MASWWDEEYRRRLKARGYEPTLDGMDDQDVKDSLEAMDRRNAARQQEEWQYPRYKPVDPGLQARILRMFGQPYDKSAIDPKEAYYLNGWDDDDDDTEGDEAPLQVKPAQNVRDFAQSPTFQYRPRQDTTMLPSRWQTERTTDNGQSGPSSYRRDALQVAYPQPSAAASKEYIQGWYDANVWTDPDVLAAATPEERETAIHRIIASKGGELLKHYNTLHVNENDAEAARMNDVRYISGSLGKVQGGPDGSGTGGTVMRVPDMVPASQIDDAMRKAINITASFEGKGYETVAGNYDGMGVSLGVFQWNLGKNTLQPMLSKFINEYPEKARQIFGKNFDSVARMLGGTKAEQMNWAKSINDDEGRLLPDWQYQFIDLCKTKEFQEMQRSAMSEYLNRAHEIAEQFNLKSERGLALALDIAVQNWSIDATDYIKQRIAEGASEKEILRLMAHAIADQSDPDWQEDVRARKLAIAEGRGRVHRKDYDLEKEFGLNDVPYR